jgi:hypothetical protein
MMISVTVASSSRYSPQKFIANQLQALPHMVKRHLGMHAGVNHEHAA